MNKTQRLTAILAGLTTLALILTQPGSQAQRLSSTLPSDFAGRYIAAIADEDFLASTYHDGKLPAPNSATDTLSILNLPLQSQSVIAQILASNSVRGSSVSKRSSPVKLIH